jgi:hypothetical protein
MMRLRNGVPRWSALGLSLLALLFAAPAAAQNAEPRTDNVRLVYQEPQNEKHVAIRAAMQDRGLLDMVGALLNPFRLPRPLTVEVLGCQGRENAWYGFDQANFCYEYVELIQRHSPKVATPGGVQRSDAILGATLDTILHEVGHAIFDILQIPVLGREEDAADFFSIYLLLQFPPEDAKRLIEGVAFTMGSEAREDFSDPPARLKFAGPHGLNAQRHYNVVCLAFGANPALFGNLPPPGLPAWRAKDCAEEWTLLKRSFEKAIMPHVDEPRLRAAIAAMRFHWSPLVIGAAGIDKPPLGD